MHQHYDSSTKTNVNTDEEGIVRGLMPEQPFVSDATTAQAAAQEYLEQHAELLGVEPATLANLTSARETQPVDDAGSEFRIHTEKQVFDTTTVAYDQTYFGLPVWEASVAVHLKQDPYRVVAASSTRHPDLTAKRPSETALKKFKDIDETTLADLLGLSAKAGKSLKITGTRLVIYQYEAAKRQPEAEPPSEDELVAHEHPTLELPPLPASIMEDDHYVSAVVHFELGTSAFPQLNWRAIIDVATGAVLHLRPFVDDVRALVFEEDPITTAPSGPLPSATSALLNPKRVKVPLQGLNPPVERARRHSRAQSSRSRTWSRRRSRRRRSRPAPTSTSTHARTTSQRRTRTTTAIASSGSSRGWGSTSRATSAPLRSRARSTTAASEAPGNVINAHCIGLPGGVGHPADRVRAGRPRRPRRTRSGSRATGASCCTSSAATGSSTRTSTRPTSASRTAPETASRRSSTIPISEAPDRFVTFPWVNIGRRHDRPVQRLGLVRRERRRRLLDRADPGHDALPHLPLARGRRSTTGGPRQPAVRSSVHLVPDPPRGRHAYARRRIRPRSTGLGASTARGRPRRLDDRGPHRRRLREGDPLGVREAGALPARGNDATGEHGGSAAARSTSTSTTAGTASTSTSRCTGSARRSGTAATHDGQTTHQDPVVGKTNYAYVKIKNRGHEAGDERGREGVPRESRPSASSIPNDWRR